MGKKNHLVNVRLTNSQILFLRELTGDCFRNEDGTENLSDTIRFAIDFLNVMLSKKIAVDISDHPEIAEKLNPDNIETEWDGVTE